MANGTDAGPMRVPFRSFRGASEQSRGIRSTRSSRPGSSKKSEGGDHGSFSMPVRMCGSSSTERSSSGVAASFGGASRLSQAGDNMLLDVAASEHSKSIESDTVRRFLHADATVHRPVVRGPWPRPPIAWSNATGPPQTESSKTKSRAIPRRGSQARDVALRRGDELLRGSSLHGRRLHGRGYANAASPDANLAGTDAHERR